jgi:hypothetical protein
MFSRITLYLVTPLLTYIHHPHYFLIDFRKKKGDIKQNLHDLKKVFKWKKSEVQEHPNCLNFIKKNVSIYYCTLATDN